MNYWERMKALKQFITAWPTHNGKPVMINDMIKRLVLLSVTLLQTSCFLDTDQIFDQTDFLSTLSEDDIQFRSIPIENNPSLSQYAVTAKESNSYLIEDKVSLLLVCESGLVASDIKLDANSSLNAFYNENLVLLVKGAQEDRFIQKFLTLQPPLTYKQTGVFIYPLSICLLITVFVIAERSYSLRSGLTFPRKVEKALRSGEFPNKNWGRRSAAERISLIATQEKPSQEALLSYSRLEVAAMEKGLFLLEIVVAGAPLIGLLGTATGLVQVFSSMPTSGLAGGAEVFSEGIALALLTTIIGLAIAIPALIGHAYLIRIVEKRSASIDWLTARLIDATATNKNPTTLN